jgi:hypothetical protein
VLKLAAVWFDKLTNQRPPSGLGALDIKQNKYFTTLLRFGQPAAGKV